MGELVELTAEEVSMVKRHREKIAMEKASNELLIRVLVATADYEKWLQENSAGSSYTTFLDDFGYQGVDPKMTFNFVEHLRRKAKEAVRQTG